MSSSSTSEQGEFNKRAKLDDTATEQSSTKVIGTHSGTFQADEAMGVWMLRQIPTYKNSKVIRTRDPDVYNKLDIVIDVGGIYNHEKKLYDHHQRDYDERFDSSTSSSNKQRCTKLSASGLVYRHYGKELIKEYYPNLSSSNLDLAYNKIYDKLLEALDAIDTGVEMVPDGIDMAYKDNTGLSSRVSRLNPRWNEEEIENGSGEKPINPDERFELASNICGEEFVSVMTSIIESDIPARAYVEKAVLDRNNVDDSNEIIKFSSGGLPWRDHLYELEKQYNINPLIKFVLYTDQAKMWRVQAVTIEGRKFENRLSLPEEWRGVRDTDLAKISGIDGAKFCHASGFIGGAETYDGVLQMAQEALKRAR